MRHDVQFDSDGTSCAGWLYLPDGERGERAPGVVMAHGFIGVDDAAALG